LAKYNEHNFLLATDIGADRFEEPKHLKAGLLAQLYEREELGRYPSVLQRP
jgi:hypothetical protein